MEENKVTIALEEYIKLYEGQKSEIQKFKYY